MSKTTKRGFTLIELLVVIAIIGILASVIVVSMSEARMKGRDGARKKQVTEILKALELFYGDNSAYPLDGTPADGTVGDTLTNIGSGFINGTYFKRLPDEPDRYQYCVSDDRQSIMIAVNTENDKGGTEYCKITRGTGVTTSGFGCTTWMNTNANNLCSLRF